MQIRTLEVNFEDPSTRPDGPLSTEILKKPCPKIGETVGWSSETTETV